MNTGAAGLIVFFWQEMQIRRTESGNCLRALPQLCECVLHRILEEQSISPKAHISARQVDQKRKRLDKKIFLEGSLEGYHFVKFPGCWEFKLIQLVYVLSVLGSFHISLQIYSTPLLSALFLKMLTFMECLTGAPLPSGFWAQPKVGEKSCCNIYFFCEIVLQPKAAAPVRWPSFPALDALRALHNYSLSLLLRHSVTSALWCC